MHLRTSSPPRLSRKVVEPPRPKLPVMKARCGTAGIEGSGSTGRDYYKSETQRKGASQFLVRHRDGALTRRRGRPRYVTRPSPAAGYEGVLALCSKTEMRPQRKPEGNWY